MDSARPARSFGLTGGIGSGKSTVSTLLTELGAAVIDADDISRGTTAPGGAALPAIARTWGESFITPDGALHRERMRELVFHDPAAKAQLEAIIHPLVAQETERRVQQALDQGRRWLVFDVPLLVESGRWRARVDHVLVVDCEVETQVRRVMARSGMAEAEVRRIIAAQASRAQRRQVADSVIVNEGLSLAQLRAELRAWAAELGL